ncbi:unnamed protein product [Phytophthora fragariaefolia]|uniref:Unnamed protein product n=1 Tax=Phytophthora fragariaefolia TaxID=1490495 RepID=A0A9W6X544_9STRA|nr:unnamed protein product [Phytophthora fragariaefolia]
MHVKAVGRRNKNTLQAGITWTNTELEAFDAVRGLITASAPQHFPAADADTCVLSDASHGGWGLIVSQVRNWNDEAPVYEQDHELLICKGGLFKGSSLNWSIVEKEAYPLVKACTDLEYLLQREKGFRMYTDHANLMYIFNPSMEIKRHVRDKLQRWAMRLWGLRYTIEHINGSSNVWADMFSRWGQPGAESGEARCLAVRTRSGSAVSAIRPLSDPGFKWPQRDEIVRCQRKHVKVLRDVAHEVVDGVIMVEGRMWVPDSAHDMLARLMVIAHCGSHGHRGEAPMATLLSERFAIHRLPSKVQKFLQGCLLCKHIKGGHPVQRPWGPTFKAERHNEGVHWDYLTLGESFGESAYVLVIKDALTHYSELFPSASPSAWNAADGMVSWYMRYGKPEVLVSDQRSHFRNEMVKMLCSKLKVEQAFTPVYSPWVNGTIERVSKDILQVLRALIEYKLDAKEWPYLRIFYR